MPPGPGALELAKCLGTGRTRHLEPFHCQETHIHRQQDRLMCSGNHGCTWWLMSTKPEKRTFKRQKHDSALTLMTTKTCSGLSGSRLLVVGQRDAPSNDLDPLPQIYTLISQWNNFSSGISEVLHHYTKHYFMSSNGFFQKSNGCSE